MPTAKKGDRVQISYLRARERNHDAVPKFCEFTIGSSEVIASIDKGVIGMNPGQVKQIALTAVEAFGEVQKKLIRQIPRDRFPKKMALSVGKRLASVNSTTGSRHAVTVLEVTADSVLVDGNHRMAGKDVKVDITLISISASSSKKKPELTNTPPKFDLGELE